MAVTHIINRPGFLHSAGGSLLKFFVLGATIGSLLLLMPFAHHDKPPVLDVIFTAVSAITVTGLATLDTGTVYTPFGQLVIALLIQAGGLGYMLIGTMVLLGKNRSFSLRRQSTLGVTVQVNDGMSLFSLIRFVLVFSTVLVSVVMVLMALFWVPAYGWREGLWRSLFHAVSAFNNAGFSLFADSLMSAAGGQAILWIHAIAFIIGGLGFTVIYELYTRAGRLSVHSRIMLMGTAILLVAGTLLILVFERDNATMGSGLTRLGHAFFQAATTRTAGFNSVDLNAMSAASQTFMMINMVIGAGPGSTAGGLRLTTFALLIAGIAAALQNRDSLRLMGRTLPQEFLSRASGILVLTLALLSLICLMLLALEPKLDRYALIFEAVSALGTVGLSLGVTSKLGEPAQILIIVVMLIGKVSPVILFSALTGGNKAPLRYATAHVSVG